jgi:hypothetical protein
MATNSFRERLIQSDVEILETLDTIRTVDRRLPTYSELQEFALTQLPVACVVGGLPKPENHFAGRTGQVDQIVSLLRVDIYIYLQENEEADSEISNMLDELWPALYSNPRRDDLCMSTYLDSEEVTEIWRPFVAFKISCFHRYKHSTGGI